MPAVPLIVLVILSAVRIRNLPLASPVANILPLPKQSLLGWHFSRLLPPKKCIQSVFRPTNVFATRRPENLGRPPAMISVRRLDCLRVGTILLGARQNGCSLAVDSTMRLFAAVLVGSIMLVTLALSLCIIITLPAEWLGMSPSLLVTWQPFPAPYLAGRHLWYVAVTPVLQVSVLAQVTLIILVLLLAISNKVLPPRCLQQFRPNPLRNVPWVLGEGKPCLLTVTFLAWRTLISTVSLWVLIRGFRCLRTLEARCRACSAVHLIPLFRLVPWTIFSVPPILSLTVLTQRGPLRSLCA